MEASVAPYHRIRRLIERDRERREARVLEGGAIGGKAVDGGEAHGVGWPSWPTDSEKDAIEPQLWNRGDCSCSLCFFL